MLKTNNVLSRMKSAGFSLIEVMVGMTIGLITVLVIMQVMSVAEARKRTSTSGADSVVNAALGLYTIEREAKNAGYGLTTITSTLGCQIRAQYDDDARDFTLTAAGIVDGVGGVPDSIRFLSSKKNGVTMPTKITQPHPNNAANFFVESDLGMEDGDLVIAVPATLSNATWCAVYEVTKDGANGGGNNGNGNNGGNGGNGNGQGLNQVLHTPGQSPLNHPGGSEAAEELLPDGGYGVGDYLLNVGELSDRTYSINAADGRSFLSLTDYRLTTNLTSVFDLYPDIVQLQAVYGKDTNADSIVDAWNATAPTTNAEWQQVRALRVALVARSQTMETGTVTLDGTIAASTCDSGTPHPAAICWRPNPAGNGVAINVNIGNTNPDWQRYRYRVMETTIPLRNVIWQQ